MRRQLSTQFERRHGFSRRRFRVGPLWVVFAMFLCACASVGNTPTTPAQEGPSTMAPFFEIKGRISVRVGDRLETGQIHWFRLPREERLQFFTPFGSQVAELIAIQGAPVVLRRGEETMSAPTIGDLTQSLLGVSLDMEAVAKWTQAIGLKENEAIEQPFGNGDAWQVTAERIKANGTSRHVSRLSAIRGDTVVRLVIDEWQAK